MRKFARRLALSAMAIAAVAAGLLWNDDLAPNRGTTVMSQSACHHRQAVDAGQLRRCRSTHRPPLRRRRLLLLRFLFGPGPTPRAINKGAGELALELTFLSARQGNSYETQCNLTTTRDIDFGA